MSDKLEGALAICGHLGISQSVFMDAVSNRGLPAERNDDAVWEASKSEVDKWNGRGGPKRKASKRIPATRKEKKE
jgi:hypothetical protein